ncbi:hypothetical protein OROGR_027567 [Orobanche gracilis]
MASSALALASPCCFRNPHRRISPFIAHSLLSNGKDSLQLKNCSITLHALPNFRPRLAIGPFSLTQTRAFSDGCLETADETERLMLFEEKPVKFAIWVVFWASLSLAWFAFSKDANAVAAAADSIKASGFGLKIANSLRKLGLPDGVVVFTLATLPVLELRGAIPVGYWLQLNPATLTVLSILGFILSTKTLVKKNQDEGTSESKLIHSSSKARQDDQKATLCRTCISFIINCKNLVTINC